MERGGLSWILYVLECRDGSYYCGITTDIERRLKQHNAGQGAKYTRGRGPVHLLVKWSDLSRQDAAKSEYFFKSLRRPQKRLAMQDPNWPMSLKERSIADDSSTEKEELTQQQRVK